MRSLLAPKNKKGQIGIILFFAIIFMVLIVVFIAVVGSGILNYFGDTITPVLTSLGTTNLSNTSSINFSQAASYAVTPVNTFVQNLGWVIGFVYVVALLFSIGFVISYEANPNPIWMGLYFIFMVFIVLGAIVVSNMYQDIYSSNDDIGTRLQEQTLASYMILYSPFIIALIAIIAGIYLFARPQEASGGFGV